MNQVTCCNFYPHSIRTLSGIGRKKNSVPKRRDLNTFLVDMR